MGIYSQDKKEEIREGIHRNIDTFASTLLPEGRAIGDNWVCGDAYGNPGDSFNLCIKNGNIGKWNDFQSGEGGDEFKLIQANMGVDFVQAIDWASEFTGIEARDEAAIEKEELREKVPTIINIPKGSHVYTDSDGVDVIAVHRREGKRFAQLSRDPISGKWASGLKYAPDERPLYNLKTINEQIDMPIIFHEGERCVDQAVRHNLYGTHTTTIGGASNPHKSDLSPVKGREVFIVPDNDTPGKKYGKMLTSLANDYGATKVSIIKLPKVPVKGDIVEWLAMDDNGHAAWRKLVAKSEVKEDTGIEPLSVSVFGNGVDPGPVPHKYLTMPGFIDKYTDYITETSIYPNRPMAFASAIPMMGFLTAGKITDQYRTQTNTYVIGIAPSGSGKNRGRVVNKELANKVGLFDKLGEQFASSEGIEDAMARNKFMLYQNDEINHFLDSSKSKVDLRTANIMSLLLRFYGDSVGLYSMRNLAKDEAGRHIVKPNLSLFGTAVPEFFFESMSFDMITSGFFSRCLIIESKVERRMNKNISSEPLPDELIEIAQWWADFEKEVIIDTTKEDQFLVPHTEAAQKLLLETVETYDQRYRDAVASSTSDTGKSKVGSAVWSRSFENINKLALIASASKNYEDLVIDEECVQIAIDLYHHQALSNLYNAGKKVHINAVDKEVTDAVTILEGANGLMKRAEFMRSMSCSAFKMKNIQETLLGQGIIEIENKKIGKTKPTVYIRLKGYNK